MSLPDDLVTAEPAAINSRQLLAERAANRAAEAAQDAVALMTQGRLSEAAEYLTEAERHARTARERLASRDRSAQT